MLALGIMPRQAMLLQRETTISRLLFARLARVPVARSTSPAASPAVRKKFTLAP